MLYIVGTVQEAEKIRGIFSPVIFQRVFELAEILDENYGKDRNIFGDDGGYICIVENENDLNELKLSYGIDVDILIEEYSTPITDNYIEVLFLFNNEFGMTFIIAHEIGHIWLGHTIKNNIYGKSDVCDKESAQEIEANRFASV